MRIDNVKLCVVSYYPALLLSYSMPERYFDYISIYIPPQYIYLPNPYARVGYDTRSIFKQSLTGFNS